MQYYNKFLVSLWLLQPQPFMLKFNPLCNKKP